MIFSVNLIIMLGWAAVSGDFRSGTLVAGFVAGYGALWLSRDLFGPNRYHARVLATIKLVLIFLYELFKASFEVAAAVLRPRVNATPRFVEMPLDARTDVEIMLTANLISLTPGTLSVDVSPDRGVLLVHAMFGEDPEAVVASMKEALEKPVLEALR